MPPVSPQTPSAFQSPAQKSSKSLFAAILLAVLFVVALIFGLWAYQGRQNYKTNADKQASDAAAAAASAQQSKDQASFADQLKQPFKTFSGPATYGSIRFSYPKNWSVYLDQSGSSNPVEGYFYPDIVPSTSSGTNYALRVEIVNTDYSSVIQSLQQQVQAGALKSSAYVPAKLAKNSSVQTGTMFVGALNSNQSGAEIVIPVRSQVLELYTQSNDFLTDFNKIVLPSLTFSP